MATNLDRARAKYAEIELKKKKNDASKSQQPASAMVNNSNATTSTTRGASGLDRARQVYNEIQNGTWERKEVARNASSVPTPSYTRKSDEEVEALRNKRDEVKTNINKRTAEYNMKYRNGYIGNEWELKRDLDVMNAELDKLNEELKMYDYDEYLDKSYEDTFVGRFKANYAQGRLGQDSSAAWNEYYANPSEENRQYAEYVDAITEQFQKQNIDVVGEGGWVDKSFANYAPQLIDQTKASVKGGAAGAAGALALNATGILAGLPEEIVTVPLGIKAGVVAASGKYSYDNMRGAAFRELIKAGVDEDIARQAASDEAFVSALIEMADTGFDIATLGVGSLINSVGKVGVKGVAKQVAKEGAEQASEKAIKKVMSALGKYGLNVAGEGLEEASQELISLANMERAMSAESDDFYRVGGTNAGNLIYNAVEKARNLTPEEALQIRQAAEEGAKISAMMGGATAAGSYTANAALNSYINNRNGRMINTANAVDDVIATGLESAPETENHRLATALQAKREAGQVVTDSEVGKLYAENMKAAQQEETELRNRLTEIATEMHGKETRFVDDTTVDETANVAETRPQMASEVVLNNVELYDLDKVAAETAQRSQAEMEMQMAQNEVDFENAIRTYGKSGANAFGKYYNRNESVRDYNDGFSRYYESGLSNVPFEQIETIYSGNIEPEVRQAAYMAGLNDRQAAHERDVANQKVYYPNGKLVDNEESRKLRKTDRDFLNFMSSLTGNEIELKGENTIKVGDGSYAFGEYSNGRVQSESTSEILRHITVSHEINHGFQRTAPKEYHTFRDYAVQIAESHNGKSISVVEQYMRRYGETREKAMDEIASDFTQKLFKDRREMQKFVEDNIHDVKKRSMLEKFFDAVHAFLKKIETALGKNREKADAAALHEFGATVDELKQARQLWLDELKATKKAVDDARTKGITSEVDVDGTTVLTKADGTPVAMIQKDGNAQFSLKTYRDSGRAELVKWLNKRVKSKQIDRQQADDIIKQMDDYYELCAKYADKYAVFGKWSNAAVVSDDKGKPVFSVVIPNGEYKMNFDFSPVCKKRRTLDAVFSEMIRRGIMDELVMGEAEIARINDIIRKYGFETACALCFVDSKRYRQARVADSFVEKYNSAVNMILPKGTNVKAHHFDFIDTGNYTDAGVGLHTLSNKEVSEGIGKLKELMADAGEGTVPYKIAKHLIANPQDRKLVSRSEFMNTDGFGALKIKNPDVLSLYNSAKGSGGPKASFPDVQYLGEVIKKNNITAERAYAVGGVRIQSFSDYMARLVFDYLQMFGELAAKKSPAHTYTKEELFVLQFGLTGDKINMSAVPAVVEGGVAAGLDANGNYAWYEGQSFGAEVGVEGSAQKGFERAVAIQNADGYTNYCGITAVGVSDEHILKMLDDKDIRMIIPYHKSSLNPVVAAMTNISKYEDYTKVQNTRYAETSAKIEEKDFAFNVALRRLGDAKAAANEYVAWCKKKNFIPKFDKFAGHENYYKLLIDFACYDRDGNPTPQGAVTMTFPTKDDAFGSMAELIERGLSEEDVLEGRRTENVPKIVDEIERTFERKRYSLKEVDPVQPTSNKWGRSATFAEVKAAHPTLFELAADEAEKRNPTQIHGTVKTYRKIYDKLKAEGFDGTILDASSGLGYGTEAGIKEYGFKVDDIEPFPDESYKPKYTDYSTLHKKYDFIISNAVLNVLPQDLRDNLTVKMGELLADGGRMIVNVRGRDVENASSKVAIDKSAMEYFISSSGSYQKGFKPAELVAYLQDALGEDFTVEPFKEFGGVMAMVTKKGTRFSLKDSTGRQLTEEQAEYFKDSKVRDSKGNLLVMYHSSMADFTVFDKNKAGSANGLLMGEGFYFTYREDMKYEYGDVGYEVYLNMKNPFVFNGTSVLWQKLLDDNGIEYDKSLFEDGGWYEHDNDEIDESEMVSDTIGLPKLQDFLVKNGYDGIIWGGNGEYIVFEPEQIKLTSNLKPTSNPDIRYSLKNGETVYAPPMYSQLERTVEQYKGDKISANGLIPYLKGKGVKDEEIKWSGIAAYIEGKKSIPKADLLGFLRANELYIDEQILAGTEEKFVTADGERILNSKEDFKDYVEMYVEDGMFMFMDYFPYDVTYNFGKDRWEAIGHYEDDDGDKWTDIIMQADPEEAPATKWSDYILDGGINYRELLFVMPDSDYSNQAMSVHWGRSGVLAHARVQYMPDDETGELVLFVEEIQSDWHNEGKKKGYEGVDKNKLEVLIDKAADLAVELKEMISGELSSLIDKALPFYSNERDFAIANLRTNKSFLETLEGRNIDITAKERDAYREFVDKQHELRRTDNELRRTADYGDYALVPDAPFKDSYVNYVLKRLIRDCAENGFDRLAWTTSDIQADRWSEDFREGYRIEYDQEIPKFLKKYGKQWGAALGQMEVAGYTVPYIEINEKMRESVLYEGQPRFSLKKPVEETKTLVALHNLSEEKLRGVLALGGFPMPSIAVTRYDIPHTNFGDITLVMKKSSIDPKANKKNTVYSADAWTPTFPQIEYEADEKVRSKISKKYYALAKEIGYDAVSPLYNYVNDVERQLQNNGGEQGIIDSLKDDTDMMNVYLADIGKEQIKPISKEVVTRLDDDKIEQYEYLINGLGKDVVLALSPKNGESPMTTRRAWAAEHGDTLIDVYKGYLKDIGGISDEEIENIMESSSFSATSLSREVVGARNYIRNGAETTRTEYDSTATKEAIRKATNKKAYEKWLTDLFTGLTKSTGIYNNKDYYTPSGNMRSFKQTHYPVTLENIVKAMAGQNDGNTKNVSGFHGVKTLRAGTAERFKSIADMHAREGRLQHLTEEQAEAINDALANRLYEIINKVAKTKYSNKYENDFMITDSIGEILMEIADSDKYTVDNIAKVFAKYQYKVNNALAIDIRDLLFDTSQMPVNIFEAKPERVVGFDEVLAAVVPENTNEELITLLKNAGVQNILTYKPDNVESRLEAVNSVEGSRFSLKGTSDILKENAKLKEYNDYLKSQMKVTKGVKPDPKSLKKAVREILKEYDSEMNSDELYTKLENLFKEIAGDKMVWEDVKKHSLEIARDVLSSAVVVNDELYESYSGLRQYLKVTGITLSESDKASISDGFNNFRKANMGRIKLVNDGLSVDRVYQELADMHPEFFDADRYTNPAEQLEHIAEVLDSLRPYEENPYSYDMENAVEWAANNLVDKCIDIVQAKPTFADKQKDKLNKQKAKDAAKIKELKDEKNKSVEDTELAVTMAERAESEKRVREQREKFKLEQDRQRKKLKQLRKEKNKQIERIQERQAAKEAKMSERRKASVMRAKILRHIAPMKKKLLAPTDNQHVQEELRTTVAAVLSAINTESKYSINPETEKVMRNDFGLPTARTEAFRKLKEQLEALMATEGNLVSLDPSLLGDKAEGIDSKLEMLLSDDREKGGLRDIRIDDMNSEQLTTVWEVLRAVETAISKAGKAFASKKYGTIVEMAYAFDADTATLKRAKNRFKDNYVLDLENPYTFFAHFGQAGKDFFRELRDAQDKAKLIDVELAKKVQQVVSSEQIKKLNKELVEFKTSNNETLVLSKAHIMEIYLLYKRAAGNKHLLGGGIHQPEINNKIRRSDEATKLTAEDYMNLFKNLGDEERKIADGMQKLMLFLAEKGNEASMNVYGYKKFNDPNYWTIKVASSELVRDAGKTQDTARSVKNMGSAKPLVEEAKNSVYINGIFDTFVAHASEMITYSAWLEPMEDANKLFNFKFKDAEGHPTGKKFVGILNKYAGVQSDKYWMNLMKDIQNGISAASDDAISKVINKTIGNVKKASVAGNIRVVLQQPTAYLRAMIALSPDEMFAGIAKELAGGATRNGGWKKAIKYAPIAAIKQAGGFEVAANPTQLSDVLFAPKTFKGKAIQFAKDLPLMGASSADAVTWGAIWNACETRVAKRNKALVKGSDEFNQAVKELFTDVIDQTQVVDGVLQRSQIMRSSNALNKQATSFMGEPISSLNLFMRAYNAWNKETDHKKRSAALGKMSRAIIALMVTNVATAAAQSVADAFRDDDEEKDYLERLKSAFTGIVGDEKTALEMAKNIILKGNLGETMNPAGWIPYVKDVISTLQGYTVERMDASAFSDLVTATQNVIKSLKGEGKWTTGYAVGKMMTTGLKLFGSSAGNIERDIESIIRTSLIETDNWKALYDVQKKIYDVNNKKALFLDIAYQALKSGDREAYEYIEDDLYSNGVKPSDIENGMKSRYKKDADAGSSFVKYAKDIAGIRLTEEEKKDSFTKEDLSNKQEVSFKSKKDSILDDIEDDFESEGINLLDKAVQNDLIEAANKYAEEVALKENSDGQYNIKEKWIKAAYNGDLGLSPAEYIMQKEEHSAGALTSKNTYAAYEAEMDIELYLDLKELLDEIEGKDKKAQIYAELVKHNFSDEQMDVWADVYDYKNWNLK